MTKQDIVLAVSEATGLSVLQTQRIIQKTMDAIAATLIAERRVELRGFGVFEVKKRSARRARNPRTGDTVFVPEKLVAAFKPAQRMKYRVQELEPAAEAVREAA